MSVPHRSEVSASPSYRSMSYTVPTAANSVKFERLKELESSVLLRRSEIENLRQRKDELAAIAKKRDDRRKSESPHAGRKRIENSASTDFDVKLSKSYATNDDPTNPLNNPILAYVDSLGDGVLDVTPDKAGYTEMEFNVAANAFEQQTAILIKTMKEIELQIRQSEREQAKLNRNISVMATLTGMPEQEWTSHDPELQQSYTEYMERSTAPGYRNYAGAKQSLAKQAGARKCAPPLPGEPTLTKMRRDEEFIQRQVTATTREVRDVEHILKCKARTLLKIEQNLEKRKEEELQLCAIYDKIRCKERDIKAKKVILRELMEEHEQVDDMLEHAQRMQNSTVLAIMDRDLCESKKKVNEAAEEKRSQERIIKAQELRLLTLKKRISTIMTSLRTHKLDRDVERLIAEALELQNRHQHQQVSASNTRGGGALVLAQGEDGPAFTAAAMEIALMSRKELYNIDTILPPGEKVHPAVYSLFVSEKEKIGRRVGIQRVLLSEKSDVVRILGQKVEDLAAQYEAAQRNLRRVTTDVHLNEEEQKATVVEHVAMSRSTLQELLAEKTALMTELRNKEDEKAGRLKKEDDHRASLFTGVKNF